ncbi:NAD-dependent epimerase/dehydratase family protein [Streptomyces sp. RG80]|uniref:dTDP-glucose 4,6-dehydratase n=1 Tax=Streptomyces sp. RG80 TaxID=3157340 RepID=UPI00338FB05D
MTTRVLVTGGAGFLGSHYVRALLGPHGPPDVDVTVLDLREPRDPCPCAYVRGDICDSRLVGTLVPEHDQVVHFAARTPLDGRDDGFVRTNVLGTHTLLDAALRHGLRTFVHVSTDEVYGSIRAGSWPETDPLRPISPYAASKAAADLLALSYHRTHGLDVRVVRGAATYGPRQWPDQVVPLLVIRLLQGRPVRPSVGGPGVRDWIHVDDHVRGIELVRTRGRPGEVYNIGGDERSDRELTALLLGECGAHWHLVESTGAPEGQGGRCSVDFTKIRTELGYTAGKDLTTGLAETVAWYRTHRSWWEPLLRAA